MAWVRTNPVNLFASLYTQNGDTFAINEYCLEILEDIFDKLTNEDSTLHTFRRAIGFGQNIRKNLIPILLHIKNNTNIANASRIIDTIIKILVNLTIPIEYLLSIEVMSRTDVGRCTIFEMNRLLTTSKEVFTENRSTKVIVDYMKDIIENDSELNSEQCNSINNCLLLFRNILHIPENKTIISNCHTNSSKQNQIIWNLFTQSIDKIIIYLLSCPQRVYWSITMVQLIALMYKDQHVGTLQKLLNLWLEASYSESSEDNESNTSPPEQGSDDSSPVVTSDPTSDSSDTGGTGRNKHNTNKNHNNEKTKKTMNMKRNKSIETETSTSSGISSMGQSMESSENEPQQSQLHVCNQVSLTKNPCMSQSSQSETSDCGYVTQIENQESISTSSNDDDQSHQKPIHQKTHIFQKSRYNIGKSRASTILEKKELRRKKLVKRSKTNIINMKGLMHHLPTDEDIYNILKEFTVDFLLKGYGTLVKDLYTQLLTNMHVPIDTSHFFWLLTYFLKFATQLELDPEHISPVLSYEIFSYLVFQGVRMYEELELSYTFPDTDLKPGLRRLHLVVTALREFLQGIENYLRMIHLNDSDKEYLTKLQEKISKMENLKMLFILLLKQYNPNIQSRQYLEDLIVTNHIYLLFLDNISRSQQNAYDITQHLTHFASVEIIRHYGLLLENFKENGEFVNNCIFTMMHHIGGDLKNIPTLFQPSILKTFSRIWETDYELCDDWSDLIEYVIQNFINTSETQCIDSSVKNSHIEELDEILKLEDFKLEWTKAEKYILLKCYNESMNSEDIIDEIIKNFKKTTSKQKTRYAIIKELLAQNIINSKEYSMLIKSNKNNGNQESLYLNESYNQRIQDDILVSDDDLIQNDIQILTDYLTKQNQEKHVCWLQKLLIEICHVKLILFNSNEFRDTDYIIEPIVYYFVLLNLPIPIIPWTSEQSNILKYQPFLLLLHKLGINLPADTGKIFVQIPNFWTVDHIFDIAQQLGPIDGETFSFFKNKLHEQKNYICSEVKSHNTTPCYGSTKYSMADTKQTPPMVRYSPLPNTSEWFHKVLHKKINPLTKSSSEIYSSSQLSIAIPDSAATFHIPPPELSIVERTRPHREFTMNMEYQMNQQALSLTDEIERNSDTASVASDLTRMCVSDDDEKTILVIQRSEKSS